MDKASIEKAIQRFASYFVLVYYSISSFAFVMEFQSPWYISVSVMCSISILFLLVIGPFLKQKKSTPFLYLLFLSVISFVILAVIMTVLSFEGDIDDWLAKLLVLFIFIIAIFQGAVVGIFIWFLMKKSRFQIQNLAQDSCDLFNRFVGFWLIAIISFQCLFDQMMALGFDLRFRDDEFLVLCVLGFAIFLVSRSTYRIERRRKWLQRVFAGSEPNHSIEKLSETTLDVTATVPLFSSESDCDAVIVKMSSGPPSGAYRSGKELEPLALIRAPDSR